MVRSLLALIAFLTLGCAPVTYRPAGSWSAEHAVIGRGLVLSGGGLSGMPYDTVLAWIRGRIAAPGAVRAGNLLILKASGERDYSDTFYAHSKLRAVREILIPACARKREVDRIARYVETADAVLFAGGDQAHYVAWKRTKLIDAVRAAYVRGAVIGGGSAGLAIQGEVVFDSVAADRVLADDQDVATPDAVRNPYEPAISFTTGFFAWPPLRLTITDTHFARRNRFGRLAAFLARALRDRFVRSPVIYGVGVDEGSALLVDAAGNATLVQRTRESDGYIPRGAYVLEGNRSGRVFPGTPLRYTVEVTHINSPGSRYNLLRHSGEGRRYRVIVDGKHAAIYSPEPY